MHAAKHLHKMLLKNIMHSPMSFFDITPIGRIVNRFSKDIDIVDIMLPTNFRSWIGCFVAVSATHIVLHLFRYVFVWHYVFHHQEKHMQKCLLRIFLLSRFSCVLTKCLWKYMTDFISIVLSSSFWASTCGFSFHAGRVWIL